MDRIDTQCIYGLQVPKNLFKQNMTLLSILAGRTVSAMNIRILAVYFCTQNTTDKPLVNVCHTSVSVTGSVNCSTRSPDDGGMS